MIFSKSDLVFY
jgi:tetratricopeptide (TPR) repeat protein